MPRLKRAFAATSAVVLSLGVLVAAPSVTADEPFGVRINEVESNGGTPGDWIEFYNASDAPVDLTGFVVQDNSDKNPYTFPAGSIVAPGAYLVIDEVDKGVGDFDYGLGGNDSVRLFAPGGALVDTTTWDGHAATTWGLTDAGAWAVTAHDTKGAVNVFETAPIPEPAAPAIVLNEVIYDEISGFTDRVEIYNAGTETVDLTGYKMRDDNDTRSGSAPDGLKLEPGQFFVFVQDEHFDFGLGKGDHVRLYDATDKLIDDLKYENTSPIATFARCPDGTGEWAPATTATPGAANDCSVPTQPGSIVLNEVDSGPADWVELYNPGSETFDISGYEIRDNSDDHRWAFLPGSEITAGEFLVVDSDTVGIVGGAEASFGSAIAIGSADEIRLFDSKGALVDRTGAWEGHANIDGDEIAATLARCPDGVGPFTLAYATPGAANDCVPPTVAINEIVSNGDATDWVEVINIGASAVDISGWTVMDNDPFGHAGEVTPLADGTTLAPGAYFVFDQPSEFSFGLGNGDTVTLRDAYGSTVDEHTYSAHATASWGRCPNGVGDFTDLETRTKGLSNACGNPVRINEVESDGGSPDDWVELVNPTDDVLDVSGIVVKDDDDTHAYAIPAGTEIAARGYLVIERDELGFGLGGGDAVRLFEDDVLIDSTTWGAGHVATTWGRCPDTNGPFAVTTEPTKGAANICPGEIAVQSWPGSAEVRVVDNAPMFLADSSGLDFQETADGGYLWAVDNGTGTIWKLVASADGSVVFAPGWENGKRVRYQRDAGNPGAAGPDAEGITVDDDGNVYIIAERDNSAKGVNQNTVLMVDPDSAEGDLVASVEWDLTDLLPTVGANLGGEAIEWIPNTALEGKIIDENTGEPYQSAAYPGTGLFFIAMEDDGQVYVFALALDGSAVQIAALDVGRPATARGLGDSAGQVAVVDAGLPAAMALDYDTVRDSLWVMCDDGCSGKTAEVTLNGTATPDVAHYAPPAGLPNINNEGFATAGASLGVDGERPVWWFADGFTSEAMRTGTLPAAVVEPTPVDPEPTPVDPEPTPVDPEPTPVDPEPTPVDPEPTPVDPEPTPVDPEPTPVDPEPTPVDPEPTPGPTTTSTPDSTQPGAEENKPGGKLSDTGSEFSLVIALLAVLLLSGGGVALYARGRTSVKV